jgi:hypothetical protein
MPSGPSPTQTVSKSSLSLATLPLEIRDHIYNFLTPRANSYQSYAFRTVDFVGFGAISHVPPPLNLLLTCTQAYEEVLDAYFRKTTFTIDRTIGTGCSFYIEEELGGGQGKTVLNRMRKVTMDIVWLWLGHPVRSVAGDGSVCPKEEEVKTRAESMGRIVDVLVRAGSLRLLTVRWIEAAPRRVEGDEENVLWELEARKRVLAPLKRLKGLTVCTGDVVASNTVAQEVELFLANLNAEMRDRDGEENRGGPVSCAGISLAEIERRAAELLIGEGQYLLTPEDKDILHRKRSYFE